KLQVLILRPHRRLGAAEDRRKQADIRLIFGISPIIVVEAGAYFALPDMAVAAGARRKKYLLALLQTALVLIVGIDARLHEFLHAIRVATFGKRIVEIQHLTSNGVAKGDRGIL